MFILCPSEDNGERPKYVGLIERWSNRAIDLPYLKCVAKISLYILVFDFSHFSFTMIDKRFVANHGSFILY